MADVKEKIAMLLNLASNNPSENEARAALLKARELMAKHKLRPEECQKTDKVKVIREVLGVTCTALTNPWAVSLSAVIAEHYCCCAYRTHQRGCRTQAVGMVGLEDDFEIAKRIFLYAYDCVTSACKSQIKRDPLRSARNLPREVQRLRLGVRPGRGTGFHGAGRTEPGVGPCAGSPPGRH